MRIIDTHTHINEPRLYSQKDEVISRAKKAGVIKVINNADTIASFKVIDSLAKEYPDFCYSAIGIHPSEQGQDINADLMATEQGLLNTRNLVAVGEIGLDYHYSNAPEIKKRQKELFKGQIEIAARHKLPIIIHSRDAEADTFNTVIDSHFEGNAVLHCYSGSFQMALRYLRHKKNIYFGIGGVLTFPNAQRLAQTVLRVPSGHLVLETDAPFLAPVPHRGEINEPSFIVNTLNRLSELLGRDREELAEEIYKQSLEVYGIHE